MLIKECHPCVECNTTNTFILNLRSILDPSTVCCGCGCDFELNHTQMCEVLTTITSTCALANVNAET
jgi:hypothetical protein